MWQWGNPQKGIPVWCCALIQPVCHWLVSSNPPPHPPPTLTPNCSSQRPSPNSATPSAGTSDQRPYIDIRSLIRLQVSQETGHAVTEWRILINTGHYLPIKTVVYRMAPVKQKYFLYAGHKNCKWLSISFAYIFFFVFFLLQNLLIQ